MPRNPPTDETDRLKVALHAAHAEIARLTSELAAAPEAARRWAGLREAVATVHAITGFAGDTPLDDDGIAGLLANVIQNAATIHYAETALRTDAEATARTLEHHRRLFVGQQARAERDRLAADAQRWAMIRDTIHRLDAIARPGLPMGDDDVEQVVLLVLQRAARPVAPQVVRLHQAYEGTTACLHCGKPMPWPDMDVCPRDGGFPGR